jgi:hypothetical protein
MLYEVYLTHPFTKHASHPPARVLTTADLEYQIIAVNFKIWYMRS